MPKLDVVRDHPEENPIIDTHCHQPTEEFLHDAGGLMMEDAAEKFGSSIETDTYDNLIEE